MKLIIGLGNPDRRYRHTRHNVGWEVIDRVGRRLGIAVDPADGWATVGAGTVGRRRVLLAKPQTYVNLSGTAVADLRRRHRVKIEDLVIVVDDLDLPLGRLRLRPGGSHGGHNGLRSLIDALGSGAFPPLRGGIGRPAGGMASPPVRLTPLPAQERDTMDPAFE